MKNEIFRRIEKKYVINKEQYEELKKALEGHMREDRYGRSVVCNIYFDSDDYSLIRNSITKPYYKDKVRLRSYNTPDEDSKVFLEIKRKCGKVVGKRRIEMNLNQAKKYLIDREDVDVNNKQIKNELDYYFDFYNLKPKMYVAYDREAYYEIGNDDFRVTFDNNILARQYDLELSKGKYGKRILDEELYVMEIKTLGVIPLWFVHAINKCNIQPGHYSKYGVAYEELVLGGRKEALTVYELQKELVNELVGELAY